jgi:hypothetical protein
VACAVLVGTSSIAIDCILSLQADKTNAHAKIPSTSLQTDCFCSFLAIMSPQVNGWSDINLESYFSISHLLIQRQSFVPLAGKQEEEGKHVAP